MENRFDTNISSSIGYYGKSSISIFQEVLVNIEKKSFWEEKLALGYKSMKFSDFPDIA